MALPQPTQPPPALPITRRHCLATALSAAVCTVARAAAPKPAATVIYPLHLGTYDARYDYDWLVLRSALEKTTPSHGPFEMKQFSEAMSPQRVAQELVLPNGRINVMARAASPEFDRSFITVRIPIDKGLLGYRVLLVRKDDLPRFARVRSVQDLRKLRAGMGKGWTDVAVLAHAGLPPTLRLRYPLPRYLYLRRDAEGEALARRLTAGLETMVRDGTLDALFRQHKGPVIEPLHLDKRRLLTLTNPGLRETPQQRPELWYAPGGAAR